MPRPKTIVLTALLSMCCATLFAQQPGTTIPARTQTQPAVQPQGVQPQAGQTLPGAPMPPFVVPVEHQRWLDQVLAKWESDSNQVKNFSCEFERARYNINGPDPNRVSLFAKEKGKLSYHKPDKGSFEIVESLVWMPKSRPATDPNQPVQPQPQQPLGEYAKPVDNKGNELPGEHWVSNGKNIYQYRTHTDPKQLVVTPIPPDLQGENIVEGPLPFLFGAKAADLKERFWFEPAKDLCRDGYIGLHAKPKRQADAAEYSDVWVALRNEPGKPLMPAGIRIVYPSDPRQPMWDQFVFDLEGSNVNSMLASAMNSLFSEPTTPFGWKRVVEQMPQQAQASSGTQRQ
ncbi:hypothetical protein [Aeoliella mucimassa]|uniref:TIGR03009 domain-containing protein n=1 Tax=Aeoliella mucimassa TaxID=2527972 RepID=A0A518AVZ2_9BACT|nr:hypothetical protein [Aeoliella mucimassa]QDU58882.1 hypothetical protein Pan181_51220 [Aeoliella mucimassa]